MTNRTCKLEGCERTDVRPSGWCDPHHKRVKKNGVPGSPEMTTSGRPRSGPCCVEGCEKPGVRRGMCYKHRYREEKNGDPLVTKKPPVFRGPDHGNWRENLSYSGYHRRVQRAFGKASEYLCAFCLEQAYDWSFKNEEAEESRMANDLPMLASPNPSDYIPLCRPCHRRFDNEAKRAKVE